MRHTGSDVAVGEFSDSSLDPEPSASQVASSPATDVYTVQAQMRNVNIMS